MPIIIIFYQENGLSMTQIFILLSIYSIVVAFLEIPSGYLSDVWGRKNTMIVGVIFSFLGFLIYSFSYRFMEFMVAEIFLGIGQSMVSGTDSAMLYDSLLEINKAKKFMKYEGRMVSVGNFSEAAAGIAGGLLADLSIRYPFIVQTSVAFIAIPAAFLLIEPHKHKQIQKYHAKDIIKIVKYALIDYKPLRYIILYSSIIGTATLSIAWFAQPYFKLVNLKLSLFGIIWTLLNLTVGLSSWIAYKIEAKTGMKKILIIITILAPLCYILIGIFKSIWSIAIIFAFYIVRGVANPVLKDYLNKLTESNVRATILSVRNLVIRVIFSILSPFLGWYTDKISLLSALILAGILFFIFSLIPLILYLKHTTKNI